MTREYCIEAGIVNIEKQMDLFRMYERLSRANFVSAGS